MTLIINTIIDKGPIIFLRLAEGSVGQVDAFIETELGTYNYKETFANLTRIHELYDNKYLLSPRKDQDVYYSLPSTQPSNGTLSSTTGLPVYTEDEIDSFEWNVNKHKVLLHIDTDQEEKLKCGRSYSFSKLDLGRCLIHTDMADLNDLKVNDIVILNFDVSNELYILWDHYKVIEGDTTTYVPQMGTIIGKF